MYCPNCGNERQNQEKFCIRCGTNLSLWNIPPQVERCNHWDEKEVTKGKNAPFCPNCGNKVRHDKSVRVPLFYGEAQLPWNAGWDGICESCDYTFEVVIEHQFNPNTNNPNTNSSNTNSSNTNNPNTNNSNTNNPNTNNPNIKRRVIFKPSIIAHQTFVDSGTVLSGIEISITENQFGKEKKETYFYLSIDEVKALFDSLQGKFGTSLEQKDWDEHWTN
jgi:Double zinc ribbon